MYALSMATKIRTPSMLVTAEELMECIFVLSLGLEGVTVYG